MLGRPIAENVSLASLARLSDLGLVRRRAERQAVTGALGQVGVRVPAQAAPVSTLSGGNQQKALFARILLRGPRVLVADEPTRGVDVGAKRAIYELLTSLAAEGLGVLLISSDAEEILGLAHRVLVMRAGRIAAEFRGEAMTEAAILGGGLRRPCHGKRCVMDQQELTQVRPAVPAVAAAVGRGATGLRRAGILYPFLILFIVLSVASGPFFTKVNLLDILDQQSSTLIIAAAGTLVLVAGGLDLSVGAIYALAGVTAAHLALFTSPAVAIVAGIAVGLGVGLVNGVIVTAFRINALIATLAMSFVVSGLASLVTAGNLVIDYSHPGFADLARSSFLTVNTSTWTMLAVVVALGVVLARTTTGRYIYASGSNAEAARLSGVRVQRVKLTTFVISGGAAALGGVIDASRVLSAQASNGETTLTFTVLAGIVVGGTSILGGEGAMWRTVVGVLFIALIGNGFDLLGLNPLYEQIALGGILLIAVGYDAWSRLRQS